MKKALPIIIVAVLAIAGIGAYSLSRSKKGAPQQPQSQESEEKSEDSGFVGSLEDALKSGVAMKCGWKDDEGNYAESYIKSNKVYYKTQVEGRTGYVISKDNCVWTWDDTSTDGLIVCNEEEEEEMVTEGEIPSTGQIDTQGYEFSCVPATVNDSMFEAPSNVSFTNPMDMIPEGMDLDMEIPQM